MTRSDLIDMIYRTQKHLPLEDIESAVKCMIEHISQGLATGNRIEIRGFGSFSLHYRESRMARNPKTGDLLTTPAKHIPYFKPGKELRNRVNKKNQS